MPAVGEVISPARMRLLLCAECIRVQLYYCNAIGLRIAELKAAAGGMLGYERERKLLFFNILNHACPAGAGYA